MSTWLLVVFAVGGFGATSPAVTMHEFKTEADCVKAAKAVLRIGSGNTEVTCTQLGEQNGQ